MKYKRLILLNVFMLFFLVSCSSNEIRDRHISFKSEFSTSFTHIAQLEHIIQNFQITHIKDDLYEYACGTVASKEDATDLILQLLLAEEPSLRSILCTMMNSIPTIIMDTLSIKLGEEHN